MQYKSLYPLCYQNFITTRQTCNGLPSTSGLYFENLEGISIARAANIADERYLSGADLLNNCAINGIIELKRKVMEQIARLGYFVNTFEEITEFCSFTNSTITTDSLSGIQIAAFTSISPNIQIYIQKIYVKTVNDENITISVKDGNGTVVETYNISTIGGKLTSIEINKAYIQNTIRFVIDTPNIEVYKTDCCDCGFSDSYCLDCCDCGSNYEFLGDCCTRQYYKVGGFNGTRFSNYGTGLAIRGGVRCNDDSLMCRLLPHLKYAALYESGVAVLKELEASDRLNIVTVHSQEWAAAKMVEWGQKSDNLISIMIANSLKNIIREDGFCVQCQQINRPKIVSSV